jgi:hypothetical protein
MPKARSLLAIVTVIEEYSGFITNYGHLVKFGDWGGGSRRGSPSGYPELGVVINYLLLAPKSPSPPSILPLRITT